MRVVRDARPTSPFTTLPYVGQGGKLGSMIKTTVYLPDELEVRLDAESSATGVSKAELIRRGIAMLLDSAERPKRSRELPVFDSGRSRTPDEMDDAVYEHIKERAARR
ncbi:Ribbon-helix-helix domain-containing protein [Streptomyces sp. Ncost-T6T-2b]|nr:Ribbon-helix-helix domain-containing protein [Streptomyces sp. Ncost-T6T-2b]